MQCLIKAAVSFWIFANCSDEQSIL